MRLNFKKTVLSAVFLLGAGSALACIDNPYFPAVTGASWTYSVAGDSYTQTIVEATAENMIVRMEMPGQEPVEAEYLCTEDGILMSGLTGDLLDDLDASADVEVISMEGVTYPYDLEPGYNWQSEVVMQMQMVVEGMSVDSTTTVKSDSTAIGVESVTVPAGTFDAMRISEQSEVVMEMTMMGMSMPLPGITTSSETWLTEGIGMVLLVDEDGSRTELLSYTMP